jgi:hypothetical protein
LRKHLLYLTNTCLTASMWQSGSLSAGQTFENDEAGWQALSAYLVPSKQVPVLLLIDLVEEDFQRDTIPHVFGKARKTLIERRLLQLYRDTPFRHASNQGREKDGRKDDRMLFSALTNAPLLKPWLDAILKEQVPLAGIFSVALLSGLLFKKFQLGNGPVLFITHQSAGLRQSYFHEGQFRFSRLTQLTSKNPEEIAEATNLEMVKTRQFLANTRMLQRGESIDIVALDNADALRNLQALSLDSASASYRFIDLDDAKRTLGLKNFIEITVCDSLFLALLADKQPSSHYALFEQTRLYTLWQGRIILYLLSSVALAGCLFWAGSNIMGAIDAAAQTRQLEQSTRITQQRFQSVVNSLPTTIDNPHDMKSAVNLEQMITQNAPTPNALLATISQALAMLPQLNITELNWEASDKGGADDTTAQAQMTPVVGAPSMVLIGVPKKPVEIVVIKGEVLPFHNDYRTALESVHQFTVELMKNKQIQASVTHQPLDIRPSVTLNGQAGDDAAKATADFELRLVWKP